jgi:cytochrome c5
MSMNRIVLPWLFLCFAWCAGSCSHQVAPMDCDPGTVDFTHEVLPLIQSNCAMSGCHVGVNAPDGVRLTNYPQIIQHVKAGKPDQSHLYESIVSTGGHRMPPAPMSPLSQAQKDLIRLWIAQGALETNCNNAGCDTLAQASWAQVSNVFNAQCVGCHQAAGASGNVRLDDYAEAVYAVNSRGLASTLHGTNGAPLMPPNGGTSACDVAIIERWIRAGTPE